MRLLTFSITWGRLLWIMAVVNKSINPRSTNTNNTTSNPQPSVEALKRKFQRVNQEIVKQNVLLQENLARTRQEHHAILQENVRLKGRIVAIESKLRESEGVCRDTKRAIGDRINILEAIGEHLIQVTKFLRLLSQDDTENNNDSFETTAVNNQSNTLSQNPKRKPSKSTMNPIEEEEDLMNLTDHIGDVSIKE